MKRTKVDELLRNVGRRIAEMRKSRGLTQRELAQQMGYSLAYIRKLETKSVNLTLGSLVAIADFFAVDFVSLLKPPKQKKVTLGRPAKTELGARGR